jgi:hypothetical protein
MAPSMRVVASVIAIGALVAPVHGHPDHERLIVQLRGTLTKIDAVNRVIEMDSVDPRTRRARNLLIFLDKKVKLRRGKAKITVSDLKVGQQVDSTVEVTHDEADAERFVALEIQLPPPR